MPTVRELIATDPSFAAYEGHLFRRILEMRLNGTPIGDLDAATFGLPNFTPVDRDEIISVANVLVTVGYAGANMRKASLGQAPDFDVTSLQGKQLLVEHTRAVDDCVDDSIQRFFRGANGLLHDPTFTAALEGLTVLVSVEHTATFVGPIEALTEACPGDHMTKGEAQKAVEELRTLAIAGYFHKLTIGASALVPASAARVLNRFRAEAQVAPKMNGTTLQVSVRRFLPAKISLWEICAHALQRKLSPPPGYISSNSPSAALVIQATIGTHQIEYDLSEYEPPEIAPFAHVGIALWHDWSLVVAGWSRADDGKILTFAPPLAPIPDPTDGALHEWSKEVEDLLRDRWYEEDRMGERFPKIFISPVQVQWYQNWFGPGPWVSCSREHQQVVIRLWRSEIGWASGLVLRIPIADTDAAAERIWRHFVD